MRLKISLGQTQIFVILNQTPTAERIWSALPFESFANTWGKEVYFETPVTGSLEREAVQVVKPGTVCFWVQGNAIAIPFGPTPISESGECRLTNRCNVIGEVEGDCRVLSQVWEGEKVAVERTEL